jgi:protein-S-isoprenylcysteine O-methyltransferase Ste14
MTDPTTFRWLAVIGFVAVVAITAPHRIRSAATKEKLDRRQEGMFILVTLRLAGAALWFGIIGYMINPASMAWSSVPLPDWVRWSGLVVLAAALWLLNSTLRTLGKNLTDTVVTRKAHTLVMGGPYRYVRHPFYDTMVLLMIAFALLAANWFIVAGGAVVFTLLAVRSRTEEDKLQERFGEPYRAYRRQTGRFLPRFRG